MLAPCRLSRGLGPSVSGLGTGDSNSPSCFCLCPMLPCAQHIPSESFRCKRHRVTALRRTRQRPPAPAVKASPHHGPCRLCLRPMASLLFPSVFYLGALNFHCSLCLECFSPWNIILSFTPFRSLLKHHFVSETLPDLVPTPYLSRVSISLQTPYYPDMLPLYLLIHGLVPPQRKLRE